MPLLAVDAVLEEAEHESRVGPVGLGDAGVGGLEVVREEGHHEGLAGG